MGILGRILGLRRRRRFVEIGEILHLLHQGGLTVYPLAICSVIVLGILMERLLCYRNLQAECRELTLRMVALLTKRDVVGARRLAEQTKSPMGAVFLEALNWRNIALEDLDRILTTARLEAVTGLKRGLWVLGTIGSLAPFIGLFGTVVGILKSFAEMAKQGTGGFETVAAGLSEALVATAAGLGVAIVAVAFFNYLQVRVGAIAATFARSSERFLQALLYVESSAQEPK